MLHLFPEYIKFRRQRKCTFRIRRKGLIHKLNGPLALIRGLQPNPQQRTDGIEEPPAARGGDGVQIPVMEHELRPQGVLIRQAQLPDDFLGTAPGHEAADIRIQPVLRLFQTVNHGHRDAPSLPGSRVAADLQEGFHTGNATEVPVVRQENFATPDAAVGAVARAVQCNADDRLGMVVFRHAGYDMRIVMLHAQQGNAPFLRDFFRHCCGIVAGMEVAGDDFRLRLQ